MPYDRLFSQDIGPGVGMSDPMLNLFGEFFPGSRLSILQAVAIVFIHRHLGASFSSRLSPELIACRFVMIMIVTVDI